jgi:hypothetical protein
MTWRQRTARGRARAAVPDSRLRQVLGAALLALLTFAPRVAHAQGASAPFVVEYYYKIRWGYVEEWIELYKRNHYPVLLKQQELGRIVQMSAATPVHHAGEANRWDFRFTIVWKDAATAHDDFDASSIIRALYPDQERFRKEEQRRFELLLEHMDIPIAVDDLNGWKR